MTDLIELLRQKVEERWPEMIETTLLGRVAWRINAAGEYESVIPDWLISKAREYGMEVLTADWKRNTYGLRFVAPSHSVKLTGAAPRNAKPE